MLGFILSGAAHSSEGDRRTMPYPRYRTSKGGNWCLLLQPHTSDIRALHGSADRKP